MVVEKQVQLQSDGRAWQLMEAEVPLQEAGDQMKAGRCEVVCPNATFGLFMTSVMLCR